MAMQLRGEDGRRPTVEDHFQTLEVQRLTQMSETLGKIGSEDLLPCDAGPALETTVPKTNRQIGTQDTDPERDVIKKGEPRALDSAFQRGPHSAALIRSTAASRASNDRTSKTKMMVP